jgi:hypothetical protein
MSSPQYIQTPIPVERMEEYRTTIEQCVVETFDRLKSADFTEVLLLYDRSERPEFVSIKPSDALAISISRELTKREEDLIFDNLDRIESDEQKIIDVESFIEAEKRKLLAREFYEYSVSQGELTVQKCLGYRTLFENILLRTGNVLIFGEKTNLVKYFIDYVRENYSETGLVYNPDDKSIELGELKMFFVGLAAGEAFDHLDIPDLVSDDADERKRDTLPDIPRIKDDDRRSNEVVDLDRIEVSVGPYLRVGEQESDEESNKKPAAVLRTVLQEKDQDGTEITAVETPLYEEDLRDSELCDFLLKLLSKIP